MEQAIDQAILAYSRARSIGFTLEFFLLDSLSSVVPGTKNSKAKRDPKLFSLLQQDLFQFLKQDAQNIRRGVYPISVLAPEAPLSHLNRLPKLVLDGMGIYRRKKSGKTTEFGKAARELLDELPRYYRRNFHFQTEGYLSQRSAELYEHQVELLFGGAADAMRRLVIPALREKFGSSDGKGLRFLEIAAGTGRASRFVSLAFPKAKIVLTDLSEPYLKEAQKKLSAFHKFDYVQADGAHLPFQDGHFDAAYSVFLFHELPRADRKAVLKESKRVLKEDGVLTLVDSTQIGDLSGIDEVLKAFPEQYHEPFYRDYIENPMEGLIEAEGFSDVHSSRGFLSKVCSARARRIQTKSTTDAGIRK